MFLRSLRTFMRGGKSKVKMSRSRSFASAVHEPCFDSIWEDRVFVAQFYQYLCAHQVGEILRFIIEVELCHLTRRRNRVKTIWNKYCAPEAPDALNFSHATLRTIELNIRRGSQDPFEAGYKEALKFLRFEHFYQFLDHLGTQRTTTKRRRRKMTSISTNMADHHVTMKQWEEMRRLLKQERNSVMATL
mmetsp:Transcript_154/g.163  ORF Transcript_154/g.163 Transcript_154/m.163 type:complete len:189 (-) Transcript_154:51-617(-)